MTEELILQRHGDYEIIRAADGEEAVEVARAERPDLIVLDVVMPKMTGFEACRVLRDGPDTAAMPIIMATTRGEPTNVEEGYASGCNEYVTKPVDPSELMRKVEDLLEIEV